MVVGVRSVEERGPNGCTQVEEEEKQIQGGDSQKCLEILRGGPGVFKVTTKGV